MTEKLFPDPKFSFLALTQIAKLIQELHINAFCQNITDDKTNSEN